MYETTDIISFLLSFFIFYFILKIFLKRHEVEVFKRHLKDLMVYKETLLQKEAVKAKAYKRQEKEPKSLLGKLSAMIQLSGEQEKLKDKFEKAGIKSQNALFTYGIAKIVMVFVTALTATYIVFEFFRFNLLYSAVIIIFAGLAGSLLVDFILTMLMNRRQEKILKAFPDALDLMVVCAEAGLSLTATIQRVAREISQVSPDLGYEMALLSIELNMLPDRRKALENFSHRLQSAYFQSIVSNIAQAEQYGTPIAQTMRIVAEEFRASRLLRAEEKAAQLPALLTLPMMVCIFPCIYIVIMGPAIINVLTHFK